MMKSKGFVFAFCTLLLMSLGVLHAKYYTSCLRKKVQEQQHQTHRLKKKIHLLQLEWSCLTNPVRLENLSAKFLNLGPLKPHQILNVRARKTSGRVSPYRNRTSLKKYAEHG